VEAAGSGNPSGLFPVAGGLTRGPPGRAWCEDAARDAAIAAVRTALALLAGGVAVVGALPEAGHQGLRRVMGVILVLVGLVVAVTARLRWYEVDTAMRRGQPLPHSRTSLLTAVGVVVAGGLALVLVLIV
jgi:putative membrane protein